MPEIVKSIPMTVDAIVGGEGVLPGMDAPSKIVTLRLVPVPTAKDADEDRPGTGKSGALEVPFTPEGISKLSIRYGDRIDVVLQKP